MREALISKTQSREEPARKGDVIINLAACEMWRERIKDGQGEHLRRYLSEGNDITMIRGTNLNPFIEAAIQWTVNERFTGYAFVDAIEDQFDYTTYKEGAVTLPRDYTDQKLKPLLKHMRKTYPSGDQFRWSVRYLVLGAMFLYANHLTANRTRETRFLV